MKPLAKSLHTITVLVRVANLLQRMRNETAESAIQSALIELGYNGADDPHGLAAAALAQLRKKNSADHANANA